ncbi:hypothetical protein D4764_18G0009440 [Takifugu flavidus]|uniref:Uncharacterized protein n=1 Tax=Takifugu flavidus TaxID=433684 RepID=A0A5C6NTK6_9TELE|nr:hypothetical protein D4764_18G0009440 [Takifugu flavidus]
MAPLDLAPSKARVAAYWLRWPHVSRGGSREAEGVWGHAEWETSILFGHAADSHSSAPTESTRAEYNARTKVMDRLTHQTSMSHEADSGLM